MINCPTRRPPVLCPRTWATALQCYGSCARGAGPTTPPTRATIHPGPPDRRHSCRRWARATHRVVDRRRTNDLGAATSQLRRRVATGIHLPRHHRSCHITDGTSCTYLVGEKYRPPRQILRRRRGRDNDGTMMRGFDDDIARWTGALTGSPCRPTGIATSYAAFGSAHANGFQMAFCDGSVQMIATRSTGGHRRLGNRKDGQAIDGKNVSAERCDGSLIGISDTFTVSLGNRKSCILSAAPIRRLRWWNCWW